MIVPQNRLLWLVTLVLLPAGVLAGFSEEGMLAASVLFCAVLLLAVVDAAQAGGMLEGLTVKLPPVVRLSKDRSGPLEVHLSRTQAGVQRLRLGLPFPQTIETEDEELLVEIPAGVLQSTVRWLCMPRRRGNFRLADCYVEAASPLGFWAIRRRLSLGSELRVFPNLWGERRSVAALFLNRGNIGIHAQRQVGKGRDFEKLREYVPGDSYDEIHWKATAKRAHPVTKVFQLERTQEIYVIIDSSRLTARLQKMPQVKNAVGEDVNEQEAAATVSTLERFVSAALVLGLAAERQGDLFGVLTFSDRVQKFVRARNGRAHYSVCRDALYALQPQSVTPDYEELFSFIRQRMRRRALLVILTALDDPVIAESFARNVDLVRQQHLVMVNMIPPFGVQPLFENGEVTQMNEVYDALAGHLRWARLQELGRSLQQRGVRFSLLSSERLSAELVTQYLNVKRRQLL